MRILVDGVTLQHIETISTAYRRFTVVTYPLMSKRYRRRGGLWGWGMVGTHLIDSRRCRRRERGVVWTGTSSAISKIADDAGGLGTHL